MIRGRNTNLASHQRMSKNGAETQTSHPTTWDANPFCIPPSHPLHPASHLMRQSGLHGTFRRLSAEKCRPQGVAKHVLCRLWWHLFDLYFLRKLALWIPPSSWLSRVDPGSERMSFTWIGGSGGSGSANRLYLLRPTIWVPKRSPSYPE